jgi:hypothetical protein
MASPQPTLAHTPFLCRAAITRPCVQVMRLCVASVATLSQDPDAPFRALAYVQALQVTSSVLALLLRIPVM